MVIPEEKFIKRESIKLEGPVIIGSIELPEVRKPEKKKPVASSSDEDVKSKKKKRKRIKKQLTEPSTGVTEAHKDKDRGRVKDKRSKKEFQRPEVSNEEIEKQIRETLARLSPLGKSKASKHRRLRREIASVHQQEQLERIEEEKKDYQSD